MIYASREATRKAIRDIISKKATTDVNIEFSHKDAQLPKKTKRQVYTGRILKMLLELQFCTNSYKKM